jgi:hypothetical protein
VPFDLLAKSDRPRLLADRLAELAITPVDAATLEAHKQEQLRRFTPTFWHQHHAWLPVGLIGSIGCMAVSGGGAHAMLSPTSPLPSYLTLMWLGVFALLIAFGVFRAHGGARWEERWLPAAGLDDHDIPQPITRLATSLSRELPGSILIIGELLQEAVVLDPYLLLDHAGEQVCLGIWDGDRIIACARRPFDPD